jgi:hypothetical protein
VSCRGSRAVSAAVGGVAGSGSGCWLGIWKVMVVPLPGALARWKVAPMAAARSRMVCRPRCPGGTLAGSNPRPLSVTCTVTAAASVVIVVVMAAGSGKGDMAGTDAHDRIAPARGPAEQSGHGGTARTRCMRHAKRCPTE